MSDEEREESSSVLSRVNSTTLRDLDTFQIKEFLESEKLKCEALPHEMLRRAFKEVMLTNKLTNQLLEYEVVDESFTWEKTELFKSPQWVKNCRNDGMAEKEIRSVIALPILSDNDFKNLINEEAITGLLSPVIRRKLTNVWRKMYPNFIECRRLFEGDKRKEESAEQSEKGEESEGNENDGEIQSRKRLDNGGRLSNFSKALASIRFADLQKCKDPLQWIEEAVYKLDHYELPNKDKL